ncbi:MAG: UvrD-helicase domain-containing protein [Candidatus Krumholzibacteriia bacterium]
MSRAVQDARRVQGLAASPDGSKVVEASAGSGKTKVLVDRFLRLCLTGDGVDPRAVLAITFTRKATVEITERLQRQARRLAGLAAPDLAAALTEILGRAPRPAELARAAWFHESLLDDPTGLGIDTLHAFCQKVLGRFAAEVGLDPRFAVLDERQEAELRALALDRLETELGREPDAARAYVDLAGSATGARMRVASLFRRRVHLQRWLDRVAPPEGPPAASLVRPLATAAAALADDLQRAALAGTPWEDAPEPTLATLAAPLVSALRQFAGPGLADVRATEGDAGPTPGFEAMDAACRDAVAAAEAALAATAPDVSAAFGALAGAVFTKAGELRKFNGRAPSRAARQAAFVRAAAPLQRLMRLPDLLDLLRRNRTLLACGLRALDLYTALKQRDRVVDFQDLEYLALCLLTDPDTGPQVHYRLDLRLDHLLLDEFQDTNRNQWDLLRPLMDELLAGGERPRTVFVVGDVKQSIYGFRGADPAVFDEARDLVRRQAGPDSLLRLPTNFRSLPALVEAVGTLCEHDPLRANLGPAAAGARQQAARTVDPGVVRLVAPLDADGGRSGHERAAALVVDLVRGLIDARTQTWVWDQDAGVDRPRDLRRDDILVLARTKTHLATYESALRAAGIPYTPAGRGLLARSREVQDLLALLRWLTVPADDTAGATVLRSPWFRLPEAVVQDLLGRRLDGRRRTLREVLRADAAALGLDGVHDQLAGWWQAAGLLPLHDLVRRVLREGELLERAEVAAGEQARFNLLRLVDLALAADERGGSLRDFVHELEQADRLGGEEEGALPGESGDGRVRVMTVHGSKGLEAPVVILVDAAVPLSEDTDQLLLGGAAADGPWLDGAPRALTDGADLAPQAPDAPPSAPLAPYRRRAVAGLRQQEAHILYVALTRARDRLYVLGGRNDRQTADHDARSFLGWLREGAPADLWTDADALRAELAVPAAGAAAPAAPARSARRIGERLVAWTPPVMAPRLVVDNPSQLDDDHVRPTDTGPPDPDAGTPPAAPHRCDNPATRRGTRLHAWLERACRLGAMPPAPPDAALRAEWEEARATFEAAALDWLMRPAAHGGRGLCEVGVIGDTGGDPPRRLVGVIDRLLVRPDRVDIVDYKSNRTDGAGTHALAEHYRPQLAAYRQVLAALYPGREVRCWLVWTQLVAAGDPAGLTEVTW